MRSGNSEKILSLLEEHFYFLTGKKEDDARYSPEELNPTYFFEDLISKLSRLTLDESLRSKLEMICKKHIESETSSESGYKMAYEEMVKVVNIMVTID